MLIPSLFSTGIPNQYNIDNSNNNYNKSKYKETFTNTYNQNQNRSGFFLSLSIIKHFRSHLNKNRISYLDQNKYIKYLKFFYHFCKKYNYEIKSESSLKPFLIKLKDKNNTNENIIVAQKAIGLFLKGIQRTPEIVNSV